MDRDEDDGIDLLKVFAVLRRGRWWIAVASLLCAVLAGVAASVVTKQYEASATLSPVSGEAGAFGGGSSALGSLGGLASLVGFSSQGSSMRADTLATLQSGILAEEFIRKNALVPVLLADRKIEPRAGLTPQQAEDRKLRLARTVFEKKVLTVSEDTRSGIVTLKLRWKEPAVVAKWANDYVGLANDYLREKAVTGSQQNIAYLNEQLANTNIVELRAAISSLMEAEIKKQMLARGSDDYALKMIDPAAMPEEPVFPQPAIWILVAAILGMLGSAALVLMMNSRQLT